MLASVPGAAIAYALPPRGPVIVPDRWWSGEPAPTAARLAMAATTAAAAGTIAATGDRTVTTAGHIAVAVVCLALTVADIRRKRLPPQLTAIAWSAAMVAWGKNIHHFFSC